MIFLISVVLLFVAFAIGFRRQQVRAIEINAKRLAAGAEPRKRRDAWFHEQIFGCWFSVGRWFGNCFSPAIVLTWHGFSRPKSSWERPAGLDRPTTSDSQRATIKRIWDRALNKPEVWTFPSWACLIIRFRRAETAIYWRGWFRFSWQSEHIAVRFGTYHDSDPMNGVPMHWTYNGWLGSHTCL